ncbi:MAG: 60S ribosomal export protein NMD3 [Methanophagales archaeon]|nr:60S ribosomal export protein NMD3 [Methanophagales archaeon]
MKERKREKEKWSKFCPKCGKKTNELFDSLCKDCFIKQTSLIDADLKVNVNVCVNCGDYFKGKGKERTSIEEVVVDAVMKELRKRYGYEWKIEIEELGQEQKENESRAIVYLKVNAEIKGVEIEERGDVEVIFKKETCERCSRIAGGYYEGIVQIRGMNRIPTDEELAIAEKIAYASVGEADFVSKEKKLKEGRDIYVSSMECGRRISKQIVKKLGGSFSESRRLYGRKDGKNVYRVSFSVRLPTSA